MTISLRFLLRALIVLSIQVSSPGQVPSAPTIQDPGAATPHLRVLTYNIHHGAGNDECAQSTGSGSPVADCSLNLERIAAVIRASNPDIVGLQEVDRHWARSGGVDQPRILAEELGMFVCFGANLRLPSDAGERLPREYGTVLLSRFPLRNCSNSPLPRVADTNEQRGVLSADIDAYGSPLRVMVTHLSVVAADRGPQLEALVREVAACRKVTILVGDLNARPEENSLRPLLSRMRDAWAMAGRGDGATSPANPKSPPRNRIDYILVSPGVGLRSIEVLRDETVRMASDHHPVLGVVSVPDHRHGDQH